MSPLTMRRRSPLRRRVLEMHEFLRGLSLLISVVLCAADTHGPANRAGCVLGSLASDI